MIKTFIILAVGVTLLVGCATIKQMASDYKRGRNAPLSDGERWPKEVAGIYASIVGAVNPAAGKAVMGILTFWLSLRRGRRIRKSLPVSDTPFTGYLGNITGIERLVQLFANVRAGLFDVGPRGSSRKRGWKMALLLGIAALGTPIVLGIPAIGNFVSQHVSLAAGVTGSLAIIVASLEKTISKVLPTKPA